VQQSHSQNIYIQFILSEKNLIWKTKV